MTIAYYTQREQISCGNADRAASVPARVAHLSPALPAATGRVRDAEHSPLGRRGWIKPVKRTWTSNDAPTSPVLMADIRRAHLDQARAEGAIAGADPAKSAGDCPYDDRARPMTRKAWEKGFQLARSGAAGTP